MARLTKEQWEKAHADYEARGISLGEVARRYGVDVAAVSRRAKKEGWTQGKSQDLVKRKVNAVKELAAVEKESQDLPLTLRYTIDEAASERLQAEGITASFAAAIAKRGVQLAEKANADTLETLSRAHKNIAPQAQEKPATTVNVNQTQQQANLPTPLEVMARLVESAREDDAG